MVSQSAAARGPQFTVSGKEPTSRKTSYKDDLTHEVPRAVYKEILRAQANCAEIMIAGAAALYEFVVRRKFSLNYGNMNKFVPI